MRLRFQQSNLQQKDSVYIEFADAASADAAVAVPPLQPGSQSKRLECLLKQDYEKQQGSFPQSGSIGTSTGKRKQGSADSIEDNAVNFSSDQSHSRKRSKVITDQAKQIDELQAALQKQQAESAHQREIAKQVRVRMCDVLCTLQVLAGHQGRQALQCYFALCVQRQHSNAATCTSSTMIAKQARILRVSCIRIAYR